MSVRCSPSAKRNPEARKTFTIGGSRASMIATNTSEKQAVPQTNRTGQPGHSEKPQQNKSQSNVLSPRAETNRAAEGANKPGELRKSSTDTSLLPCTIPNRGRGNIRGVKRGGQTRRGSRRNTGTAKSIKRVSKMEGASPLPVKIVVETPNMQRIRVQRKSKEDLLLRQKKNEEFHCLFIIPRLVRAEITGSCMDTVFDMKSRLLSEVRLALEDLASQTVIQESEISELLLSSSEYVFKSQGTNDFIMNESLPFQRVDFVQACSKAYVTPRFCLVEKRRVKMLDEEERLQRLKKEILLSNNIAALVGSTHTSNFLEFEDEEIAYFRRQAMKLKIALQKERKELFEKFGADVVKDERITLLPEYLLNEPMPNNIPENFLITAHLPKSGMSVTMNVRVVEQACTLRTLVYEKFKKKLPKGEDTSAIGTDEDYILKATGFQDYLYGESQMLSYDCVRKHLCKPEGPLEVTLVPLSDFADNLNRINTSVALSIVDKLLVQEEESERDHSDDQNIFHVSDFYSIFIQSTQRINLTPEQTGDDCYVFLCVEIFHAGHRLGRSFTSRTNSQANASWHTKITFEGLKYSDIPLGSRIVFTLYFRRYDGTVPWLKDITKGDEVLGWVASQVFDQSYRFRDGKFNFRMWVDSEPSPIGSCNQNLLLLNTPILFLRFEGRPHNKRIYYPLIDESQIERKQQTVSETTIDKLNKIISADPLVPLTEEDKMLLWGNRHYLSSNSNALPKFLLSIHWDDKKHAQEAHKMLKLWSKPAALQALELLDAKFADPVVRDFGIECLEHMQDGECYDYMLQLTQVLKHEPYHNSALAMFLLKRAWRSPRIGHCFFWFLKAEMHLKEVAERYTILLESYLRGCGPQLQELMQQNEVNQLLVRVAEKVKSSPSSQRKAVLQEGLAALKLPEKFQLPLDQRIEVTRLQVEKCKYMDSKKLPLWLVWENAEQRGKPISVIFKVGDDLRQDALTLQIIRIFDKLWKHEGLDLLLKPYGCIATGDEIGMIEVVKNADTTANINKAAGGTKAVLRVDTVAKWLRKYNSTPEQWARAQEIFALSCAGYCVATFVLGIGDRHNDNIMLTREGNLFHIDFGHFLGNYKKKYGFKRERAPFIFTPQYAAVLDGKNAAPYKFFEETACKAFNILRRHKDTFITLFQMMLCTGIPELGSADDIDYLRNAFALGQTDEEAANYFKKLIKVSVNTKTTVINDAIHVFVHR